MTIDSTIDEYRATKERMQAIIDRHMSAAYDEIRQEFGTAPVSVWVDVREMQTMGDRYPSGAYAGCSVTLGGE